MCVNQLSDIFTPSKHSLGSLVWTMFFLLFGQLPLEKLKRLDGTFPASRETKVWAHVPGSY